ncbi:hypothetical protein C8R45DRAFT_929487 [Mycena sanguinolenta]|nr:hypothetical protein C8R45DRAFT_929487 [Mycena sanguinolenta]
MLHGNYAFPRGGFPFLRAIWGDNFPEPLPNRIKDFGPPQGAPWYGPAIDAFEADCDRYQLQYCEIYSPDFSHWWPDSIKHLHRQASREEQQLKDHLARLFPYHPDVHPERAARAPKFLAANIRLNAQLACSQAIFFIRTFVQEQITAGQAARAGKTEFYRQIEAPAAAATAAAYTKSLFSDEFLGAWLNRPEEDISLWGTSNDPRDPPVLPAPVWGSTAPWGAVTGAGTWGTTGAWGMGAWGMGMWAAPVHPPGWFCRLPAPSRNPRWFPRFYRKSRIGASFQKPRITGWRDRCWKCRFGWLRRLERQWRRREEAIRMLNFLKHGLPSLTT